MEEKAREMAGSIMGLENPKLRTCSTNGEPVSENDSMETGSQGQAPQTARHSKGESITREERMKVVRERQQEEHKRRLDELRQAQMQAMRAKQQLDLDRRRKMEEVRTREEQRRAAVDARRKRIEDDERERREAILRKHQEIFDRIDEKRRQHQSRRMVYGTSGNLNRMSDSISSGGGYSPWNGANSSSARRAVSVGVLHHRSGRPRSNSRRDASHRSNHNVFSPGSASSSHSARVSSAHHLATPSRTGAFGPMEQSVSGNPADNSPVDGWKGGRTGKHWRAVAQSQPPPTNRERNRQIQTARPRLQAESPQSQAGGDTKLHHLHTDAAPISSRRPQRPNSLMTRSHMESLASETVPTPRGSDTFKMVSKRTQSVENVRKGKREVPEVETPTVEDVAAAGDQNVGEMEEKPASSRRVKLSSEAEAKAALAEKRRQARLKMQMEAEEQQPAESAAESIPQPAPEAEQTEEPVKTERSRSIVAFEEDEARVAESPPEIEPEPQLEPVETEAIVRELSPPPAAEPVPEPATNLLDYEENVSTTTHVREASPPPIQDAHPESVEPSVPSHEQADVPDVVVPQQETVTVVTDVTAAPVPEQPSAEDLAKQRRLEQEQREEEERQMRRQRLEAIRKMTKAASSPAGTPPELDSKKLPMSPMTEDPSSALENARKLLQRRANPAVQANGQLNGSALAGTGETLVIAETDDAELADGHGKDWKTTQDPWRQQSSLIDLDLDEPAL